MKLRVPAGLVIFEKSTTTYSGVELAVPDTVVVWLVSIPGQEACLTVKAPNTRRSSAL